ncbi:MAG TPA: potassium transporter, partial [Chromatiaceae bacterium]|nr:potassium transporter [Chromatiaceae bacterium]
MSFLVIQRIVGLLLAVFSFSMLPPAAVSWWYDDGMIMPFITGFIIAFSAGVVLFIPARNFKRDLRIRDGFIVVVMFWTVLGACGALPFMLEKTLEMSITDACFEAFSALTTTGATVLVGLDTMPPAILYYRQQLQWFGGMGIIVLAVAVLPMLGVGGMQLYRAETPGPMKESKLTPRITETAKALWYIYLGLTVACGGAYWVAGMTPFDAISHAFSTVAIGGFSTHDLSIGYFQSQAIETIAVIFMLISGANYALHFVAWRKMSLRPYFGDSEFRFYFVVLALVSIVVSTVLLLTDTYIDAGSALHYGIFQVVSIGTTTGFTTAEYYYWPGFVSILLLLTSFMGGCAGSTAGGMKVIRILLLLKQGYRELSRLVHPSAQIPVRIGGRSIPPRVVDSVWGFFAVYVFSFTAMYLALAATGLDLITSFSAVAACMNNLGPGLGVVGSNYASLGDTA